MPEDLLAEDSKLHTGLSHSPDPLTPSRRIKLRCPLRVKRHVEKVKFSHWVTQILISITGFWYDYSLFRVILQRGIADPLLESQCIENAHHEYINAKCCVKFVLYIYVQLAT